MTLLYSVYLIFSAENLVICPHNRFLVSMSRVIVECRGVNRLSIIRKSIEKTDYRLRIDRVDSQKLL